MFLRADRREKDGKDPTYWSLVETVRTPDGPRQKAVLPRRTERFCASALAEDDRSLQRTGRDAATETVSVAPGTAIRRSTSGARSDQQGASGRGSSVLVGSVWKCGSVWRWTASSKPWWMSTKPTCRGRAWPPCWRSIGCARPAANCRLKSAGIAPPRWMICWDRRRQDQRHATVSMSGPDAAA
jgi:hypothetical protein